MSKKLEALKRLTEYFEPYEDEDEYNICDTCRLNQQCPLKHKPNLLCPYTDYERGK